MLRNISPLLWLFWSNLSFLSSSVVVFSFQFLIHCEGTRFTEQKHQISMQVAETKGLPKLKHHLLPRTKGFAVTVQCLRNVGKERNPEQIKKKKVIFKSSLLLQHGCHNLILSHGKWSKCCSPIISVSRAVKLGSCKTRQGFLIVHSCRTYQEFRKIDQLINLKVTYTPPPPKAPSQMSTQLNLRRHRTLKALLSDVFMIFRTLKRRGHTAKAVMREKV